MTSWRDTSSPHAQADLDALLDAALPFAQQQLDQHGEFFPYALVATAAGQTELISADPDQQNEHPSSLEVLAANLTAIAIRNNQIRACAIVSDVHLPDLNSDAIDVALEHAEGPALRVQLPYTGQSRRRIQYGQLRAIAAEQRVWSNP